MPELSSVCFLCLGAHVPVLHRTAATVWETNGNPAEQRIVPPGSVEGHALHDFFLGAMPNDAGTPIEVLICPVFSNWGSALMSPDLTFCLGETKICP